MIFDLYELIPLYLKSWHSNKEKISLSDGYSIYLLLEFGLPSFAIGVESDSYEMFTSSTMRFMWTVTGDFICYVNPVCKSEALRNVADFVLEKFHTRLLELYLLIKSKKVIFENDKLDELFNFTYSYHKVIESKESIESLVISKEEDYLSIKSFIPSLTMTIFFKIMTKYFACYVEGGKGREVKIWRDGYNIYTLGKHKANPQLHSFLIYNVIKRLGIKKLTG